MFKTVFKMPVLINVAIRKCARRGNINQSMHVANKNASRNAKEMNFWLVDLYFFLFFVVVQ
jgi:hypothetical protein